MTAVLDVSAAIQVLLQKEKLDRYRTALENASWIIALNIYIVEFSNVLRKYHSAGLVTHEDCVQFVGDGLELVDDFIPSQELWKEALGEGIRNRHSVYDMLYLVTARRNDAGLVTNDSRPSAIALTQKIGIIT